MEKRCIQEFLGLYLILKFKMIMTIKEAESWVSNLAPRIEGASSNELNVITKIALNTARQLAPKNTGRLIKAISFKRKSKNESWVISSQPIAGEPITKGKKIYTPGLWNGKPFPYHVLIELGQLQNLRNFGKTPFRLRTGMTGYMLKTAELMEKILINKLNFEIERILK